MALPRELSEELFVLCDMLIEGGSEGMCAAISEMGRDEVDAALAEAVVALIDESSRADKEIERFQRRFAKRGSKPT